MTRCDIEYHKEPPNGFVRGDCTLEINHKGACKYVGKRKDKKNEEKTAYEAPAARVMTDEEVDRMGLSDYFPQATGPIPPGEEKPMSPNAQRARLGFPPFVDARHAIDGEAPITPDMVNHPPHYTAHPSGVECITITRHMNFNLGNAVKYIWRAGLKGSYVTVEDLKKAQWYINDEIERLTQEAQNG